MIMLIDVDALSGALERIGRDASRLTELNADELQLLHTASFDSCRLAASLLSAAADGDVVAADSEVRKAAALKPATVTRRMRNAMERLRDQQMPTVPQAAALLIGLTRERNSLALALERQGATVN